MKSDIALIKEIIPFGNLVFIKNDISFEIIKHSLGINTKVMNDCIPEKAKPKMTRQGSSQNTKTSATSRNGAKKKYLGQGR